MGTLFVKYEEPTIRAFFPPEMRERYVGLLGKSNRRRDGLKILHHEMTFDPKWSVAVSPESDVAEILKSKGGGARGYVMGTSKDGCMLPLEEAVECVARESGIVVCTPGQLAYYCGRGGKRRFILERGSSA